MPVPENWSILVERAQELPLPASSLLQLQQMQQQSASVAAIFGRRGANMLDSQSGDDPHPRFFK